MLELARSTIYTGPSWCDSTATSSPLDADDNDDDDKPSTSFGDAVLVQLSRTTLAASSSACIVHTPVSSSARAISLYGPASDNVNKFLADRTYVTSCRLFDRA